MHECACEWHACGRSRGVEKIGDCATLIEGQTREGQTRPSQRKRRTDKNVRMRDWK